MVEMQFYISDDDMDRLWAVQGKDPDPEVRRMSGNDFAKMLLLNELKRLHPKKVNWDDED